MPSIFRMMGILASFANRNSDVKSYVADLESKVLVEVKEEEPFSLEIGGGKVSVHKGRPEKFDAAMKSDKQTLMAVISGKLSQEEAFNRKLIETSGSLADAMRFRYVINLTLKKSRLLHYSQKLMSIF